MSAEAPRNSGERELVPPQVTKGSFSRFLERLFGVPSEPHPTQQPISRIIETPPGLEDFAAKLHRGIDNHLTAVSKQELERKNAEAARIAAEAEERMKAAERQKDLEEQEKARKEKAFVEASEVLRDFQVAERLGYIQKTVWGGKGEIRPVEPEFGPHDGLDRLGGLELIHRFPYFSKEEKGDGLFRCGGEIDWRYVPATGSTRLNISVLSTHGSSEGARKVLKVTSDSSNYWSGIQNATIPIDTENSETLLEGVLVQDAVFRTALNHLPSQEEEAAMRELTRVKRQAGWMKWIVTYDDPTSHG